MCDAAAETGILRVSAVCFPLRLTPFLPVYRPPSLSVSSSLTLDYHLPPFYSLLHFCFSLLDCRWPEVRREQKGDARGCKGDTRGDSRGDTKRYRRRCKRRCERRCKEIQREIQKEIKMEIKTKRRKRWCACGMKIHALWHKKGSEVLKRNNKKFYQL